MVRLNIIISMPKTLAIIPKCIEICTLEKSETDGKEFFHCLGVFFVYYKDNNMIIVFNHSIMVRNENFTIANKRSKCCSGW